MATYIFGGLTAAVLLLSIWIGHQNNKAFENQVDLKERAERQLVNGKEELAALTAKHDETVASKEAAISENTKETSSLEEIQQEVTAIEGDIASKEKVVSANETKIAANEDMLKGLPNPDVLVPQITVTKNKIAELKSSIDSDEVALAGLKKSEQRIIALTATKRRSIELQTAGKSLASLSTSIQGVYRNWGFVTLNGGNAHGVVPGSTLDVLRNGEVIAKLKVTAVEQNRAAADIIPNALPVTIDLRSGDRVVAEKIAQQ